MYTNLLLRKLPKLRLQRVLLFSGIIQNANESLFTYDVNNNQTFASYRDPRSPFTPVFGLPSSVSQQLKQGGLEFCTRNSLLDNDCYYDYLNTNGNQRLAAATLETAVIYNSTIDMLGRWRLMHIGLHVAGYFRGALCSSICLLDQCEVVIVESM